MRDRKKILVIGELYKPLIPWFLYDEEPKGVPGVYNLYKYLSESEEYCFHGILYNKDISIVKNYDNGSILEIRKFNVPTYYLWKLFSFFKLFIWSKSIIKNGGIDLIYGLSTFSTIASIVGRRNNIPSVGRIYGTILTKPLAERKYFTLYTRFFFDVLSIKKAADIVVATYDGTQYDKVFEHWNREKKVRLYYNGMEKNMRSELLSLDITSRLDSEKIIKLCYIARLEYYKRQELAIEVIESLVTDYRITKIKLTILGSGNDLKKLERIVDMKSLNKYIDFVSEVDHNKVVDFLERQDVAMFFYEGGSLGNVLWESGMAGKLLVLVNNGDTGEFEDGKNCIMENDVKEFPQRIAKRLASVMDKDISYLTHEGRNSVERNIKTWEERFDKEFKEIFELLPSGDGESLVDIELDSD